MISALTHPRGSPNPASTASMRPTKSGRAKSCPERLTLSFRSWARPAFLQAATSRQPLKRQVQREARVSSWKPFGETHPNAEPAVSAIRTNSDCEIVLCVPTAPGCQLIERRLRCVAVFLAALRQARRLPAHRRYAVLGPIPMTASGQLRRGYRRQPCSSFPLLPESDHFLARQCNDALCHKGP